MAVVWVVLPCSLVDVYQRFRGHCPDDRGSKDLWNVGELLPDYTVLQPRRQPSSYSPPWEPQILLQTNLSPTGNRTLIVHAVANHFTVVCNSLPHRARWGFPDAYTGCISKLNSRQKLPAVPPHTSLWPPAALRRLCEDFFCDCDSAVKIYSRINLSLKRCSCIHLASVLAPSDFTREQNNSTPDDRLETFYEV
jgi:hypothetical protein